MSRLSILLAIFLSGCSTPKTVSHPISNNVFLHNVRVSACRVWSMDIVEQSGTVKRFSWDSYDRMSPECDFFKRSEFWDITLRTSSTPGEFEFIEATPVQAVQRGKS